MENVVISLFIAIVLRYEVNIKVRFILIYSAITKTEVVHNLSKFEHIKPLDCFPCFTFWTSILFNSFVFIYQGIPFEMVEFLFVPAASFILAKLYNQIT